MSYQDALRRAAALWGVETEYWDIWGKHHTASEATLRAILTSLGVASNSQEELDQAIEARHWNDWHRLLPPTVVLNEGVTELEIRLPEPPPFEVLYFVLTLEDGTEHHFRLHPSALPALANTHLRDRRFVARQFKLPTVPPLGYHELRVTLGKDTSTARLIVCPNRAYLPPHLDAGGRAAGLAVGLYGLRSDRNWGCGDFTDVAGLIDWVAADLGAAFVALNPLHAIPNRQPFNTSPYLPNCIFYRNPLYLDIEQIPEFVACPAARRLLETPVVQAELAAVRSAEFVEYERVYRLKLRFLKLLFRRFLNDYRAGSPRARAFQSFVEAEGALLHQYAVYCALEESIHKSQPDIWLWTDWPPAYRTPDSPAVLAFAAEHWRSVLFYKYVQWQVDQQLGAAAAHARAKGLPIGLYHDLALATDRFGSDLWAYRPFYVSGCRVGAPPDEFSPKGQDWSFPPPDAMRHRDDGYRIFVESIRKNCRHGGALRIDHVMRFFRLYWIPDGMEAPDGTYVRDHAEDLLRILALESVRQKVMIIGEDLGTVTDEARETLSRFGILSFRLFYFERHPDGRFRAPDEYPRQALVSASTHDLPTLAGFWTNRDIEARCLAGLLPDDAAYQSLLAGRALDKQRMLDLFVRLGLVPGWIPRSAADLPELTGELHNAIIGLLALTSSMLMLVNEEDLTKETEQQNLPGSTTEYPNWRRKMCFRIDELHTSPLARAFAIMLHNWLQKTARTNPVRESQPR